MSPAPSPLHGPDAGLVPGKRPDCGRRSAEAGTGTPEDRWEPFAAQGQRARFWDPHCWPTRSRVQKGWPAPGFSRPQGHTVRRVGAYRKRPPSSCALSGERHLARQPWQTQSDQGHPESMKELLLGEGGTGRRPTRCFGDWEAAGAQWEELQRWQSAARRQTWRPRELKQSVGFKL